MPWFLLRIWMELFGVFCDSLEDLYFCIQIWQHSLLETFHTQHGHFIPGLLNATNLLCFVEGFSLLP
jgi:hypothetical protein